MDMSIKVDRHHCKKCGKKVTDKTCVGIYDLIADRTIEFLCKKCFNLTYKNNEVLDNN